MQSIVGYMGRDLNERDLQILKKLVPELEELQSQGIEIEYMNILPPVANHHSRDVPDFEQRLKKLSVEDMRYLADLILEGTRRPLLSPARFRRGLLHRCRAEAFQRCGGQASSGL